MKRQLHRLWVLVTCATLLAGGCTPSRPIYFFGDGDLSHYQGVATDIEYPDVESVRLAEVEGSLPPLSLRNNQPDEIWDVTLEEAIQITLANSKVMRQLGGRAIIGPETLATAPETLLRSPDALPTIYDVAITESNPIFGTAAALSAFDAQFATSVFWERNDRPININAGNIIGQFFLAPILEQDLGTFQAEVNKVAATGTRMALRNNTNYDFNNNPSNLFPSAWFTNIEAEVRQPLLQGAGTTFNRIAGPAAQPGFFFSNGIVLARINTDIALTAFEAGVRDLVRDVEFQYWQLYAAYRDLDALVSGRDSALETWRRVHALYVVSARGGEAEKEAQSREQYFLFRAQVEDALSRLYGIEARLRYIMGLASADGRLIRPADEPTTARVAFDWWTVQNEALVRNVELRRQKWVVKQREYELIATRNFLLPRLDAIGRYRWVGFGDDLIRSDRSPQPFNNAVQTLTGGDFQEWQLGLQLNMPIGFRQEMAAVRNAQLNLARERARLQDMELELSHALGDALRDVDRFYVLSQTHFNRAVAAFDEVESVQAAYETETVTLDVLLDAQRRLADAQSRYYNSLTEYQQAIVQVHFRKGSLLEYNGVYLAEGPWPAKAYFDAERRARERDGALPINYGFTQPYVGSRGPFPQFSDAHDGSMMMYEVDGVPTEAPPEEVPTPAPVPDDFPNRQRDPRPLPSPASASRVERTPAINGTSVASVKPAGGEPWDWGTLGLDPQPAPSAPSPKTVVPAPAAVQAANYEEWKPAARNDSRTPVPTAESRPSASGWKGTGR